MQYLRSLAAASLLCFAVAVPARAQEPAPAPTPSATPAPAATPADPCGSILSIVNRPTVTTGVCTVRTGHFDVETGYTNTTTTGVGAGNAVSVPQALIRLGTGDPHLDLELGPPTYESVTSGGARTAGSSDVGLGAKYELGYSSNADWGLNGVVSIPTGTHGLSAGNAQFTGNLNAGCTLSPVFSLGGTLSFNALSGLNAGDSAQSYFAFIPSLELSAALPGNPSQITAEYAYFSAAGPNLGGKSLLDFVYERDLGAHVQFDVEYGFSPTVVGGQKQHYVGAGLSFMN